MSRGLKCIAIDDEPLALELLAQYIRKTPGLELVQTFDDAIQGGEFLRNHRIDLLLIDINMPDITGLDLLRSLPEKPMTIFTTAYKKFAFEGFELDIIDYLLKPFSYDRFTKAVQKAMHRQQVQTADSNNPHLLIRSEYKMIKIDLAAILYLEGVEDYIKIHLQNDKPVMTLMTLKAILEKLPTNHFRRIHRSYIVPVQQVRSILNKKVTLSNGTVLPVSDSYTDFIGYWTSLGL